LQNRIRTYLISEIYIRQKRILADSITSLHAINYTVPQKIDSCNLEYPTQL